ncbi:MAG: Yip1 family protein [Pseudohongiellaceae bacterium]
MIKVPITLWPTIENIDFILLAVVNNKLLIQCLIHPGKVFRELALPGNPVAGQLLKYPLILILMPPVFAYIGGTFFGWRLGADTPLYLDNTSRIVVSFMYFLAIGFGFVSTAFLSSWMAGTYGARTSLLVHMGLITVVCAPLALASVFHLYPDVFLNVLVLIPTIIWCMNLLYRGLPLVLDIPPERGMLMSSALVGWLLVAAVSLLGLSAILWTHGIGAEVRI